MKNFPVSGIPGALLDLFLPRCCLVCGRTLSLRERVICAECLADLPRTHYSGMSRNPMADRLNAMIARYPVHSVPEPHPPVPEPAEGPERYSYATALFFYRAGYKDITRRLKYHSDLAAGRFFARMLGREMAGSELFRDIEVVVPVPLNWTRRWSRGYNQAEVIARELAEMLGVGLRTDLLYRPRPARTQTRLSIEKKATNVEGAFQLRKGKDLEGVRHILLVDDVFTTGATACACSLALKAGSPPGTRISVATLACVGE